MSEAIVHDADWLWCLVAMVVTKVTNNGEFYATGP